jgi:hypothetical protein
MVKVLLILSVLAALAWVIRARPSNQRLALTRLAGLAVATCWIVAVINPELVSQVAHLVGVGRGTDLVLYVLVVVFMFTTVGQQQRLRLLEDRLAELTRSQALLAPGVPADEDRPLHHG